VRSAGDLVTVWIDWVCMSCGKVSHAESPVYPHAIDEAGRRELGAIAVLCTNGEPDSLRAEPSAAVGHVLEKNNPRFKSSSIGTQFATHYGITKEDTP
jgi:hypothetical protein